MSGDITNRIAHVISRCYHDDPWAVAAAVVEELGLREEWKTVHVSGGGMIHHTHAEAKERFDNFVVRSLTHIASRYVTEWTPDAPAPPADISPIYQRTEQTAWRRHQAPQP
jgi:hypothetical protein